MCLQSAESVCVHGGCAQNSRQATEKFRQDHPETCSIFLEFGSHTVEKASLAGSSGRGSKEEGHVFLDGKRACRSRNVRFP